MIFMLFALLSSGCTEVFEMVCVVCWSFEMDGVWPFWYTIRLESEMSALWVPFRDAFDDEFCESVSVFCLEVSPPSALTKWLFR